MRKLKAKEEAESKRDLTSHPIPEHAASNNQIQLQGETSPRLPWPGDAARFRVRRNDSPTRVATCTLCKSRVEDAKSTS